MHFLCFICLFRCDKCKNVCLCGRTCFVNRDVFRNNCFSYDISSKTIIALVEPALLWQFESEEISVLKRNKMLARMLLHKKKLKGKYNIFVIKNKQLEAIKLTLSNMFVVQNHFHAWTYGIHKYAIKRQISFL